MTISEFFINVAKIIFYGLAVVIAGYVIIRAFGYAFFKSYFQAKSDNHINQKEESNGSKT
jgi:hypothetical protein